MVVDIPGARETEDCIMLKKAVRFYAHRIIDEELVEHLHINILLVQESRDFHAQTNWVEWNEFELQVNTRLCWLLQLQALAHETVHVNQFLEGRLVLSNCGNYMIWTSREGKHRKYPASRLRELQKSKGYNCACPWEVEAYLGEAALTMSFLRSVVVTPDYGNM